MQLFCSLQKAYRSEAISVLIQNHSISIPSSFKIDARNRNPAQIRHLIRDYGCRQSIPFVFQANVYLFSGILARPWAIFGFVDG
jgi:hypothetical protein